MAVQMTSNYNAIRGVTNTLRFEDDDLLKMDRDLFDGWTLELKASGTIRTPDLYITKDEVERNFLPRETVDEDYIKKTELVELLRKRKAVYLRRTEESGRQGYYIDAQGHKSRATECGALIRDIGMDEIDQP